MYGVQMLIVLVGDQLNLVMQLTQVEARTGIAKRGCEGLGSH